MTELQKMKGVYELLISLQNQNKGTLVAKVAGDGIDLLNREFMPITSEKELDEYIESFRGEATVWIEQKRDYPGKPILFPATLVKRNERRPEDPNYYDLRAEYYLVRESIGILWRAWIRKPSFERIEEVAWVA